MASRFRVELAREDEIPQLVGLIVPSFADYPLEQLLGNIDTPEAIAASSKRHLRSVREHLEETGRPCAIKCVETKSGEDEIVACAYWFVFDKPRSEENVRKANYLFTAEWLPEEEKREKVFKAFKPVLDVRAKWTVGRGHAVLAYVATDKAWRRKGAATACVQWGIDLCEQLGIPAYLEASEAGAPVYRKLGFEDVDEVHMELDGDVSSFPTMMWWPPGTNEEDKRPLEQ